MKPGDIIYAGPYRDLARYAVTSVDGGVVTIVKIEESHESTVSAMKDECLDSLKSLGYSDNEISELDKLLTDAITDV